MRICPVCGSTGAYASHRRGLLERGPLTWGGVFPYRCGQCQTRFYRLTGRAFRRPSTLNALQSPYPPRAARWPVRIPAAVTLLDADAPDPRVAGSTENVSLHGAQLRLPVSLHPGDRVAITLEGEELRDGRVCWSRPLGEQGGVFGVAFPVKPERRGRLARPFRRLLWRERLHRLWLALLSLVLMAGAAYGLVWMLEALRVYNPTYYEPKDIERQLFEQQKGQPGTAPSSR
jgi:hypothetical protein